MARGESNDYQMAQRINRVAQKIDREWVAALKERWASQIDSHEKTQRILRCDYCDTPSRQEHYCPNCGAQR